MTRWVEYKGNNVPEVQSLLLPTALPHPDAIKSWKQTKTDYESDCWKFQYEIRRYLGRVSDDVLPATTISFEICIRS